MDAALAAQELAEIFDQLVEAGDLNGAEEILASALGRHQLRGYRAFLHFQYAKLYRRWNKMSSSLNHLDRALELLDQKRADRQFYLLVLQERRAVRHAQSLQQP